MLPRHGAGLRLAPRKPDRLRKWQARVRECSGEDVVSSGSDWDRRSNSQDGEAAEKHGVPGQVWKNEATSFDEHVKKIRAIYRERRDVMLEALAQHFPPEVRWTHPKGGLFLWVTLPAGVDANQLFHEALKQNVVFVSGGTCSGQCLP